MKKRIMLRLVSLSITAAILLSCGGQLLAAERDEDSIWGRDTIENTVESNVEDTEENAVESAAESASDDEAFEETSGMISAVKYVELDFDLDNDELAEQYINQNMYSDREAYYGTYNYDNFLSGDNLITYHSILPHIKAIAAGTESSSIITVPEVRYKFNLKALGLTANSSPDEIFEAVDARLRRDGFDTLGILVALLESCPFDMYWMDKTLGFYYNFYYDINSSTITVYDYTYSFIVAKEYRGVDMFTVNTKYGQAVSAARSNAKKIVASNAAKDDYSKLLAYSDTICAMVDYNYPAVENESTPYGNPWQLIWALDGDDRTKVVCEGYSKAFQYLCDITSFDDDRVYAICVFGDVQFSMGGGGAHMWNLVHMDDGQNYLVDTTATDTSGGISYFLLGAVKSNNYGFTIGLGDKYLYYPEVYNYFDSSALILASKDYEYTGPAATYKVELGTVKNCSPKLSVTSARAGKTVTVTVNPASGYAFDYITVNGTKYTVPEFKMPAENVVVNVYCKKIVTGWVQKGDSWYYYKEDGTKATGWLKVGAWYYFDANGVMQTGWQKIGGVWYYFRSTGSMLSSAWLKWGSSWYYLQSNGAMATGWLKIGSVWYLFNSSGVMQTGWQKVSGKWYYLESSGAMHTGWLLSGGKWYYLNASGDMATGWVKVNGLWYYMDPSTGAMVTGVVTINGKKYKFADDGHCLNR